MSGKNSKTNIFDQSDLEDESLFPHQFYDEFTSFSQFLKEIRSDGALSTDLERQSNNPYSIIDEKKSELRSPFLNPHKRKYQKTSNRLKKDPLHNQQQKNKCQKKNFNVFLISDIKCLVNTHIGLKKRGKLSPDRDIFQRYFQFFSKGTKRAEPKRTLKKFLNYQGYYLEEGTKDTFTVKFNKFLKNEREITQKELAVLSEKMKQWLLENKAELSKKSKQRSSIYEKYVNQFLQNLEEQGEVKIQSQRG